MADKQCIFVDEETGHTCPRMIKSGLFCPVHDPANEKTVCYIREKLDDEEEGMDRASIKTDAERKLSKIKRGGFRDSRSRRER